MLINKKLLNNKQYVIPYERDYLYKLDVIQNYFPHTPIVAVKDPTIHCYPYPDDNYTNLIDKICKYTNMKSNNIILTNGSDTALNILLKAFAVDNAKVLIPTPTYPHFISFANLTNSVITTIPVTCSTDLFGLEYNGYNLVYIVSPNLPLGYVLSKNDLSLILQCNPNTVFIVDEAYVEYGGDTCCELINFYPNLFVTRTFSKAFGLAGVRLGYIICNDRNLLLPLVNDKNVTSHAINLANDVLDNLDHYKKNIIEVLSIKNWLLDILPTVCNINDIIYGYNLAGGNFFLLYCKNTKYVVDVFAKHGILICDKHDDVLNSVRICIAPQNIMYIVVKICILINLKSLICLNKTIVDLDGTLRNGAKKTSEIFPYTKWLVCNSDLILTNNNITPYEVKTYLESKNINYNCEIETSLSLAKKYLIQNNLKVFVYGNSSYFNEVSGDLSNCDCILLATVKINFNDIITICNNLKGKTLLYLDNSFYCTTKNCSEIINNDLTLIPDIGSLANLFKISGYNVKLIGKPNCVIPGYKFMVGDSQTDIDFAKKNNIIPVINSDKTYYDLLDDVLYVNFANVFV